MKKSLLVISVILLIAGLFISCNSEAAGSEEDLVYVTFEDEGKGLETVIGSYSGVTAPEINSLKWYYQATKTGGAQQGATSDWTAVNNGTGLSGTLGPFSVGNWKFTLQGRDPSNNEIVYVGASGTNPSSASDVKLKRGTNYINVAIDWATAPVTPTTVGLSWNVDYPVSYNEGLLYYKVTAKVGTAAEEVFVQESKSISNNKLSIIGNGSIDISSDFTAVTVKFEVYEADEADSDLKVAENSVTFPGLKGGTATISGTLDDLGSAYVVINEPSTPAGISASKTNNVNSETVAYIIREDTMYGYDSLDDAIEAASTTSIETVGLLKDVTTAANINKAITLDGNGHSIIVSGNDASAEYTGTSGSGVVSSYGYLVYADAETVTVKNLRVSHSSRNTQKDGSWYYRGVVVSKNCYTINLDNVTVDMTTAGDGTGASVRIERAISGTTSAPRTTACSVNINGCEFINPQYYGFYAQSPVSGTINKTKFSGWNALYFKPGSTGSNLNITESIIHEISTTSTSGHGMSTPGGNGFGAIVYEDSDITLSFNDCDFIMEINGNTDGTAAGQTLFMANDWNAINYNEHITINSDCTFTSIGNYEAFLVYSLTGGATFDLKVVNSLESTLSDKVAAPETNEFDSITRVSTSNTIKLGFTGTGSTYGYGYEWQDSNTNGYKKLSMPEISTGYWMTGSLVNVGEYAVPITTDYISTALTKGTGVYTTVSESPVTPTGKQWVSYSAATEDQRNGWYTNFADANYFKLFTAN